MPFPLTPSPRRETVSQPAQTDTNHQIPGPSPLHSGAPASSPETPNRPGESDAKPFSGGTACGRRSTRPTGVR